MLTTAAWEAVILEEFLWVSKLTELQEISSQQLK